MPKTKETKQTETETETETENTISTVIRKITNKSVLGVVEKPKKETMLYTLIGNIYGYTIGTSTYGEFIKFRGDFIAVLKNENKEFRAPFMLVPSPMDMALAGNFDRAVADSVDPETGETVGKRVSCEMGIEIGVKPADTPTGYEWVMRPLIEIAPTNALESLKQKVLTSQS